MVDKDLYMQNAEMYAGFALAVMNRYLLRDLKQYNRIPVFDEQKYRCNLLPTL